jgi:hypothetical protein
VKVCEGCNASMFLTGQAEGIEFGLTEKLEFINPYRVIICIDGPALADFSLDEIPSEVMNCPLW